MPVAAGNGPDSWIWWSWVSSHTDLIWHDVRNHVELTAIAVVIGLAIALPLAVMASRWHRLEVVALGVTGVVYTIPSLALFAFLVPITGLFSRTTAEIPLVSYTLLILVRNILVGLKGVSPEVREAAQGMGFGPLRQLLRIDLPLAVPAIIAGIRVATVTTIGLVTVTALIGQASLGQLILDGLYRDFHTPLVVGTVLSVALAAVADVSLLLLQRSITPWSRGDVQ